MVDPRRLNLNEQAQAGSCTTDILADSAVTSLKLAPNAVDSNALALGSVSASKLANDVFGAGLVPNGSTNAIDINVDGLTLQISSDVLEVNTVDQSHINLTGNLSFNNNEALDFRIENLASDPSAGNTGRLIWRTDLNELRVDNGSAFVSISAGGGGHIIEDEGTALPQRSSLNFIGNGVTVTDDSGNDATVVNIPTASPSYARKIFVVTNVNDKTFVLDNTPITDSEVVSLNGLVLKSGSGNDYTISGDTITLETGVTLTVGDELLVVHAV